MRILLDENLDWRLCRDLKGHEVDSVPLLGWAGTRNGALLGRAVEAGFGVFTTMDGGLFHEQNLAKVGLAVIGLRAKSNRLIDTRPLMPSVLAVLPKLVVGSIVFIAS